MTRKDYVLLAEAIKNAKFDKINVAENIASALQRDNSRFDRVRFMEACGFEVEA